MQQAADELELVAKRALLRPETSQQRMRLGGFTSQPLENGVEGNLDQRVIALGTDPEFGECAAQELQLELIVRVEFERRRDASHKRGDPFELRKIRLPEDPTAAGAPPIGCRPGVVGMPVDAALAQPRSQVHRRAGLMTTQLTSVER
jgi:hypothetical protein